MTVAVFYIPPGYFPGFPRNACGQAKQGILTWLTANMAKPRGIVSARHHKISRRNNRWADKSYKKAHLGTSLKANPFGGASHAKGIVLEKV